MKSSPTILHTSFQHCQGLDCLPFLRRLDFMSQESHSYLWPFKFFVDLVTESDDVFPVFLPIRWVSGFIFGKGKRTYYQSSKRNSIKCHALPREKHLTSIATIKKEKEVHTWYACSGKRVCPSWDIQISSKNHCFPKKQVPNLKYLETCYFHTLNESTR